MHLFILTSLKKGIHFNFLKSCTLFDHVAASKITQATRFWSLKTFSMLFTEEDVHLTMAL